MNGSLILIFLVLASFATAIISAVVGMAGGIILLSLMTFFMPLSEIVPIHGLVQLSSNSVRTFKLKEHVIWKIFIPMTFGLSCGTIIAAYILKEIENREVFYMLIVALIMYVLFKPKKLPQLKIPFWAFGIVGIIVGVLNPLIGATGPMMAPFYLRDDFSKEQIVATKASAQAFGHLLKLPTFLYLGFDYLEHTLLIVLMIVGVVLGTQVGVKMLHNLKENAFRVIYRSALFVAALRLSYKIFFN